ncbi:GTP pyrophosphokinase [Peptoniphilus catoniae]|uniref:GTP pyrophosphokinase n=1 Tax=Peptoniphilus catoniae TaxID=1660341 RepID=UPI0010FE15FA|nr:(p)ppGpp synthetase [Peptoniphilus catoniae]
MKIELFQFIDESVLTLRSYNEILRQISNKIVSSLKDTLYTDDNFSNISYRIKSESSLKEKIIKNNFFLKYNDAESMIMNLSDLIGVRIECRFIKDEEEIYNLIKKKYNINQGDGYYKNDLESPISLKLSDKQPQVQVNGFEIYKIDCRYQYGKNIFNFELQIKSMVNVFWGEIDHKILYKNYNYMLDESFFRDIMSTIKDSLYMIDRQLLLVFEHVSSLDASAVVSANKQIDQLLSKIIHDVYSNKVREELGFVFNFKHSTDIIVEFLQLTAAKKKELSYGENFVKMINRINDVSNSKLNLQENIKFESCTEFSDKFTKNIFKTIMYSTSRDLTWNLTLKIIIQMQNTDPNESIIDFLNFIRSKYSLLFIKMFDFFDLALKDETELENYILNKVYTNFRENRSMNYLVKEALEDIETEYEFIKIKGKKPFDIERLKVRFENRLENN